MTTHRGICDNEEAGQTVHPGSTEATYVLWWEEGQGISGTMQGHKACDKLPLTGPSDLPQAGPPLEAPLPQRQGVSTQFGGNKGSVSCMGPGLHRGMSLGLWMVTLYVRDMKRSHSSSYTVAPQGLVVTCHCRCMTGKPSWTSVSTGTALQAPRVPVSTQLLTWNLLVAGLQPAESS